MDEKLLTTEQRNPASWKIDTKSTTEILTIINEEDKSVPQAVATAIPQIATLVDDIVAAFVDGGRLFYIGAGTSGRLGVLDASECPPTYGVSPDLVQGIIAGGEPALTRSIENAEDDGNAGVQALMQAGFTKHDVLIGITASGGAAFVLEAIKYANEIGAKVGAISCNEQTPVFDLVSASRRIYIPVGPEIITGSTRMKSGTAQKLVLNMLTTTAMIRTGKVYNNLMVNLMPVNAKLVRRAQRLISEVSGCTLDHAKQVFSESGKETKTAMIMAMLGVDALEARRLLTTHGGSINKVLDACDAKRSSGEGA
ncbi:MAG: N-acetylmuramic acid 6-phosphate etherase [Sphaerochaetaceae bacterium]|jgi:N-acetylmuramic acid 6-phosphate etherase